MSRTAAAPGSRWKGWRGAEVVRRDDPRWFPIHLPKKRARKCPGCRVNGLDLVAMRVWVENAGPVWRCPCCGYQDAIDQSRFSAWLKQHGKLPLD